MIHHADISAMFDHDSLAIMDFEESLKHVIKLLRESPAVPKHIELYCLFYEISSGNLTEVVRDIPDPLSRVHVASRHRGVGESRRGMSRAPPMASGAPYDADWESILDRLTA